MTDATLPPQSRLGAVLAQFGWAPRVAMVVLALIALAALAAPWIAPHDPLAMDPLQRLKPPTADHPLGTDNFGRDLFSRVLWGGRVSLLIGIGAAVVSVLIGMAIGLVAGFFRTMDAIVMRIMDALMAIPAILLAIALVALNGPSIGSVIAAITIPEIPRVVRLVRAVVLSAREEPYVEAALALGTPLPSVLVRHLLPNTIAPMIVQGTYILASAILTEAILSFLGAGVSTETPTWGNIMAEGRTFFRIKPELILWPGLVLSLCILSVNLLGDAARDMLDPRLKKRAG
ncbi:peptide ABC transporter permease [Paracoccus sanguinis]|uniref:Peptide/nickel transport system permease protein n=2 Tax=Paracoccus sanguinis TaxID=1545044 RepID=A0A1H3AJ00_9RHOB|nr:peptide ABC transporter permease [Paracoccus sanguinis]SDX29134.1 peptide/nickel transport system permease protein [Paracoccus sanguinis]